MAFQFKAVRLPFLRVHTSKTGKTSVTWKFGPLQRNRRTGQTTIRLGRKVKWVGKTKAQKSKAKTTRTVARMGERKQFDAQFAAGETTRIKAGKATGGTTATRGKKTTKSTTKSAAPRAAGKGAAQAPAWTEATGLPVGAVLTLRPGPTQATWQRQANGSWRNPTSGATVTAEQMQGHLAGGEPYEANLPDHLTYGDPIETTAPATGPEQAERQKDREAWQAAAEESRRKVGELDRLRAQTHQTAVTGGLCGAPTRDGSSCLNKAGGCPHHEPAPRP